MHCIRRHPPPPRRRRGVGGRIGRLASSGSGTHPDRASRLARAVTPFRSDAKHLPYVSSTNRGQHRLARFPTSDPSIAGLLADAPEKLDGSSRVWCAATGGALIGGRLLEDARRLEARRKTE